MKIAILLVDGAKQIMLSPETEHEKQALRMIQPGDTLETKSVWGTYTNESQHYRYFPQECRGGYYREFNDTESLMFVITEKKEEEWKPKNGKIDPEGVMELAKQLTNIEEA